MARTVDPAAHSQRRNEFLDAAQGLLVTKGYERMTIQDVLEAVGTSKGALYHYFDSKQALLEGLVERLADEGEAHLVSNLAGTDLPAVDKLRLFFLLGGQWKVERREVFLATLAMWCSDENAVFRHKMAVNMTRRYEPLLTEIIAQGTREGVFTPAYPNLVTRVVVGLLKDCGEALQEHLLTALDEPADPAAAERMIDAYTDAFERVLGAPSGSLVFIDTYQLRRWFEAASRVAKRNRDRRSNGELTWQGAGT